MQVCSQCVLVTVVGCHVVVIMRQADLDGNFKRFFHPGPPRAAAYCCDLFFAGVTAESVTGLHSPRSELPEGKHPSRRKRKDRYDIHVIIKNENTLQL